MAFTPIETQEQLDALIKDRLQRDREAQAKKYEGWISPEKLKEITDSHDSDIKKLTDAVAEYEKTIAAKDKEISESAHYRTDLEKAKIALAAGLKIEHADRLRGETEEEWKADAKILARDFAATHPPTAPLRNPEAGGNRGGTREQFANFAAEIFNNN